MKPHLALIALLFLANTALCQTPKWTFQIPAPSYPSDATQATMLANDSSGGSVFLLSDFREAPEITSGAYVALGERLVWLDRNGKLLHMMNRPGVHVTPPVVAALSATVLHIRIQDVEGGTTLSFRRVVRTAKGVVFKDITPPANETVVTRSANIGTADTRGYFTLKSNGPTVTHIVRYTP